jgi:hypothetical protein
LEKGIYAGGAVWVEGESENVTENENGNARRFLFTLTV